MDETVVRPPQVGDIWLVHCRPWGLKRSYYHLLITEFFESIPDEQETCAARCLVLESGEAFEIYNQELIYSGNRVS